MQTDSAQYEIRGGLPEGRGGWHPSSRIDFLPATTGKMRLCFLAYQDDSRLAFLCVGFPNGLLKSDSGHQSFGQPAGWREIKYLEVLLIFNYTPSPSPKYRRNGTPTSKRLGSLDR